MANIIYRVTDTNQSTKVGTRELKEIVRIEVENDFIVFKNIDNEIVRMTPTPNKDMRDKVTIGL